jgi:mRNA-degrading endonuclease RelE of RelBE toxin-antitoxin system
MGRHQAEWAGSGRPTVWLMYEVLWLQAAVDELFELAARDARQARRTLTTVRSFGRDGRGDLKKLQSGNPEWRLRAGNWRVFLVLERSRAYVTRIDNRRDAY